jgi:hypothetical protein
VYCSLLAVQVLQVEHLEAVTACLLLTLLEEAEVGQVPEL